jgi:hypothetical protein
MDDPIEHVLNVKRRRNHEKNDRPVDGGYDAAVPGRCLWQ